MGDRREKVVLDLDKRPYERGLAAAGADTEAFARKASKDIDRFSGRLGLAVNAITAIGPGLIPIGAVGVPAVAGLTQELGFAALAGGSLLAATQGVGDAVKALEKARLDPTAANLEAAQLAMSKLGPDARDFAKEVQGFLPTLRMIRDSAAAGWFPGLTDSLDDFEVLAPKVAQIFKRVGREGGQLIADGADSLTSGRWWPFLNFISREAPAAIADLGHTVGNLTHGLAEMWMAFSPLNTDFSDWLLEISNRFDVWATKLDSTQGFQEFIDYIRTNGPVVVGEVGSLGNALLQIVEAAAPLGGPTLRIIGALADALAALADSDLGTPLFALASLTSTMKLLNGATGSLARSGGRTMISNALGLPELRTAPATYKAVAAAERELVAANEALLASNVAAHAAQGGPVAGRQPALEQYAAAQQRVVVATQNVAKAEQEAEKARAATRQGLIRNGVLMGTLAVASTGVADKVGLSNTAMGAMTGAIAGPWGAAVGGAIGLAMDLGNAFDGIPAGAIDVHDSIEQITAATKDQVLAGAVNVDQMENQAKANIALAQALGDTDLEAQARAALRHAEAIKADAVEHQHFAAATEKVRQQQLQLKQAFQKARQGAMEEAAAWGGLGDKLDDAKTSLAGWIRQLQRQADALHNFRINAQTAADKGLRQGLIAALEDAGPAGALRMRQLANATKSEIAKANAAWAAGQREMQKYVDFKVPPKKLTIDDQASRQIALIKAALASVHDKTVTVRVTHSGTAAPSGGFGPTGFDSGGYTGNYPAHEPVGVVHGGEFVFDAIATARAGVDNLYAMQRNLRGYGPGGYVGEKIYVPNGGTAGVHQVERYETGPRVIHLEMGSLGRIVVDVATGVAEHHISESRRRESVVAGE